MVTIVVALAQSFNHSSFLSFSNSSLHYLLQYKLNTEVRASASTAFDCVRRQNTATSHFEVAHRKIRARHFKQNDLRTYGIILS